jgi:hypothetical protein
MITVDGKEYSEDDLTPEQKANVAAILRIRERMAALAEEHENLRVAAEVRQNTLAESLKPSDDES